MRTEKYLGMITIETDGETCDSCRFVERLPKEGLSSKDNIKLLRCGLFNEDIGTQSDRILSKRCPECISKFHPALIFHSGNGVKNVS